MYEALQAAKVQVTKVFDPLSLKKGQDAIQGDAVNPVAVDAAVTRVAAGRLIRPDSLRLPMRLGPVAKPTRLS